jgi:hypothetical protein
MTVQTLQTPPRQTPRVSPQIHSALSEPAKRGKAGFDELLAIANRESALKPNAQSKNSSASGLFQFTEQTWLDLVRSHGAKYGIGDLAKSIAKDKATGRNEVPSQDDRAAILALRRDPKMAAAMAGELTERNRASLQRVLGREPTYQEVYAAHFLGARGAIRLIKAAEESPDTPSNKLLPAAANANRAVFHDREARRFRTAGEVAQRLEVAQTPPAAQPNRPDYLDGIATVRGAPAPVLSSLLQAQLAS